jgi:hypothetical protein
MAGQSLGFPRGADLHNLLAIDQPGVMYKGQGDMSNCDRTPQGARAHSMRRAARHQALRSCASVHGSRIHSNSRTVHLCPAVLARR